ncbi:TonB-dependent receptor domain-containing protein [Sphingomonas sp.]|uniref:TonB-dependent receptor domain-containing protein n=1 Tax=Sphingomonas sp. TaxID=28214 RepID=UPI002DD62AB3|nr:TonB-dependent receptor [Sphingomonas sp.]
MRYGNLRRGGSRAAMAAALACGAIWAMPATAQTVTTPPAADTASDGGQDVVVTGSRIDIGGFDAPTPTTVVGATELRLGNRPSIGQVLNDLPQFRATTTPQSTVANTSSGTTTADLRGLGSVRTLVLLNGRRSVGVGDLNVIPLPLVERVEIVTGGAAAAYGSGAVSGVVNILLDRKAKGLTLDAQAGISSRGDAARYSADASWGTSFADGRGHFAIGGSFTKELGAFNRDSRPNIGSTAVYANPTYTATNGQSAFILMRDVNFSNASPGGLIVSGALAGQTFNPDGTLRPFIFGSPRTSQVMVGGEGISSTDEYPMSAPYERYNSYGRLSFDVADDTTLWVDGLYNNISAQYLFYSEVARGNLTFSRDNPFLRTDIRNQLVAAGQTTFSLGRIFTDYGQRVFGYRRSTWEGGIGIDGSFSDGRWKYSAFYSHGESRDARSYQNQRITTNLANALDAVRDTSGNIVCRVALTTPNTPCRPLDVFGSGRASKEAIAYAFTEAYGGTNETLDSGGFSLRGEALSLWAGPLAVAIGAEARREGITSLDIDPVSRVRGFTQLNFAPLDGSFSVKEGFGEVSLPLLDAKGTAEIAVNAGARYSDYSNTGGIWSWKVGGTARLFDDLLLRVTRSRDIRSAGLSELYTTLTTTFNTVADPFTGNTASTVRYGGGNVNLTPEVAQTFTAGVTWSPGFIPRLKLSADYYSIDIDDIIVAPTAQDIVTRCFNGQTSMCGQIERNSANAITAIYATFVNYARLKTKGIDFEASYVLPMSDLSSNASGQLRFRALGTYTDTRTSDDGITVLETVGTVGDGAAGVPRWRANASVTYESTGGSVDLRLRHVGGGVYNAAVDISNNAISAKTYVDLGARVNVGPFTLYGTVNNLFDLDPPLTTYGQIHYDQIGRYYSIGTSLKF